MFTGIVTDLGRVKRLRRGAILDLTITTTYDTATIPVGASIACSGACLTASWIRRTQSHDPRRNQLCVHNQPCCRRDAQLAINDHPYRRATIEPGQAASQPRVVGENGADPDPEGQINLAAALEAIGKRGITRLLVEGGAGLGAALIRARLVDRLAWVHAPLLLGGDSVPAIAALGLPGLGDAPHLERLSMETLGNDMLTIFRVGPTPATHAES